jgi:NitT/TauT family transport system substrate-binding protein
MMNGLTSRCPPASVRARAIRGALAAALALLIACASPAPPPVVRVATIGSIDELPLFVIQEQGLDRKHGWRAETSSHVGGARILEEMAALTVDAAWSIGTVPLLAAAEAGAVPVHAIAIATNAVVDEQHPGIGVVVAPAVNRWQDLSGKVLGVYALNSLGGAALRTQLQRERVTGYRLVEIAMPNLGLALAGGAVAAVALPEPFVSQSVLRRDGKLLDWIIGGAPLERMVYTTVTVRTSFSRAHAETVKGMLRAHLDAVQWINANQDASRAIMARRLGITDELGRRISLTSWPADGRHAPPLFTAMQEVLMKGGLLRSVIPPERVFDTSALDAVLREHRRS